MQKCYNVMVTGKVQDIGFRTLIEDIARMLDLKGFVFNDIDGSVKMVCYGENGVIGNFLKEIRIRGEQKGVVIENIKKEEIPFHIYLLDKFLRLYTDELADIGRKLDIGNELLKNLPEIKTILGSFVVEQREQNKDQREYNKRMDEHNKEQREHNKRMDEHNLRLEKILEKLAER